MTPLVTIHDDDLLPPLVRVLGAEVGFDLLRIGIDDGAFVIERAASDFEFLSAQAEQAFAGHADIETPVISNAAEAIRDFVNARLSPLAPAEDEPIDLWPVAEPQTDPELVDHEILDMLDGREHTYSDIESGVANMLGTAAADMVNERLDGLVLAGTVAWRQTSEARLYTLPAANGSDARNVVEPVADGIQTLHGAGLVPGGEVAVSPAATSPELPPIPSVDPARFVELQRDILDILETGPEHIDGVNHRLRDVDWEIDYETVLVAVHTLRAAGKVRFDGCDWRIHEDTEPATGAS